MTSPMTCPHCGTTTRADDEELTPEQWDAMYHPLPPSRSVEVPAVYVHGGRAAPLPYDIPTEARP